MKSLVKVVLAGMLVSAGALANSATDILKETNFKGGLIVHLGCGDGELTAALWVNERCLVHGLDTDQDAVAKARRHIRKLGLYGRVSVEAFDAPDLPYADNMVNLLVAENPGRVPLEECMRVLAPNGVAYIKSGNKWKKIIKPWPDEIDEWTHHLHDAGGNAVAKDAKVGPPQHLQWTAGPLWARSHGYTPSVSAMVSAGGRIFYICDETLACVDGTVPSKWFLLARDAFSGVLLWKRPMLQWGSEEFSGTPGTGESIWRINRPQLSAGAVMRMGFSGMFEYLLTVMVYHDGVVLLAQPEPNTHHTYHTMPGMLYAFNAQDGTQMWKHPYGGWGHCTQPDVFVVGQTVWTHVNAETEFGSAWGSGFRAKDPSVVDYRIQALDLRTGELQRELSTKEIFNVGHHHRCYRNKITERFLMSCRRGVEFVDFSTGENYQNHWVRSGCLLGYLPCNGLLYVTPHPCSCYISAKLTGFNALAPKGREGQDPKGHIGPRLEKGPAYGQAEHQDSAVENPDEWPTYRHDPRRSGATESAVGTDLQVAWKSEIGTRPSALVVASGKVLVAGVDTHSVHALDADNGKEIWSYTAGSRVDSPPTLYDGLAIFGSADGRVYCLRADDGALVWRFDAAPRHRFVTAFGQLESPWPIPGSVLVHDGKCWFAAGRSSYLDGGIHFYAVEPATGKVLHSETIYSPDPETGKMAPEPDGQLMAGLLNDIPATDGANVFIRQMKVSSSGDDWLHLYTTGGYLDPSWFNRTNWQIGRAQTSGLMVLGKDVAYGVEVYDSRSRETVFSPGTKAYRLGAIPLKAPAANQSGKQAAAKPRQQGPKFSWEQRLGIRVTAMVRARDAIFVAGSPDVVDPTDPHGAWEGRKGGLLAVFVADDGKKLAEYELPAPPVWDGMAAASGRLFISTSDGSIVCMKNR